MSGFHFLMGRFRGGGRKSAVAIPVALVTSAGVCRWSLPLHDVRAGTLQPGELVAGGQSCWGPSQGDARRDGFRQGSETRPEGSAAVLRADAIESVGLRRIEPRAAAGLQPGHVRVGSSAAGVVRIEPLRSLLGSVQVRVQSQAVHFYEETAMSEARNFDVTWREGGTATVLARLTSRTGSGAATGVKGEGNWVEQADLASISYQVFDETEDNVEVTSGPVSVSVAGAILDVPVTSTVLWTADTVGYNFLHDLPPTVFPEGGHVYRVEYKFAFLGGAIGWGVFRGEALAVFSA